MRSGLPATVDPIKLADAHVHIAGKLPVKAMRRLCTLCLDDEGQANVSLYFECGGDKGLRHVRGLISVRLHVACQRCLEQMTLALTTEPSLIVVRADEHTGHLAHEAALVVANEPVALSDIVEDELLLAMPMIPMHDTSECPAGSDTVAWGDPAQPRCHESPFFGIGKIETGERIRSRLL